MTHNEVKSG